MANQFHGVFEKDGEWYIGYCPEVPGANGQGKTLNACKANLAQAIKLIMEDRLADGLQGVPADAIRDTITVE